MSPNDQIIPKEEPENEPKDRSAVWMAVILGGIILVMTWLTLFVDDPWQFFRKSDQGVKISSVSPALNNQEQLADGEVRQSLVKFIEAFYFDQRRGYFDPPSYFAPITETFYNYHRLTYQRLKELYWKRRDDMQGLTYSWNPTSLEFHRDTAGLVVTYWAKEEYYRPSRRLRQSADVHYELVIDGNGKIVSLRELEVSNFESPGFSEQAIDSVDSAGTYTSVPPPASVPPAASVPVPEPEPDQKIYELGAVDVPPEYPGGARDMQRFLTRNIIYPAAAENNRTEGKVFVGFVIEKNGAVSGVNVLRGIGSGCDEEAARVVRNFPAWKPATVAGRPVRNAYVLSVAFKLDP